jgi:hypothetical protein
MTAEDFTIKEVVMEIRNTVTRLDDKFDKHLTESIELQKDVAQLQNDVSNHHTILYDPQTGLIYRMRMLEDWAGTQRKVMWEIAKPGLGMIGILLVVGVGILATLLYGLQVFVQNLTP